MARMKEEMATQLAGSGHDARDSTARRRHDGGAVASGGEQLAPLPWTSFMNHHIQSHTDHTESIELS